MKKIMNYESSSGVVHEGKLYGQHKGITKCRVYFNIHNAKSPRWYATNKDATCKVCRPVKKAEKIVFAIDEKISIFGINSPEKATFATIRARLLSAMETWRKHANGEIDKERFNLDMRHDLKDLLTDVSEYTHRYKSKRWCYQKKRYVPLERPIKHNLDGKVPR